MSERRIHTCACDCVEGLGAKRCACHDEGPQGIAHVRCSCGYRIEAPVLIEGHVIVTCPRCSSAYAGDGSVWSPLGRLPEEGC